MAFFGNLFFCCTFLGTRQEAPLCLSSHILLAFSCAHHLVTVSVTELGFFLLKGVKILKILS